MIVSCNILFQPYLVCTKSSTTCRNPSHSKGIKCTLLTTLKLSKLCLNIVKKNLCIYASRRKERVCFLCSWCTFVNSLYRSARGQRRIPVCASGRACAYLPGSFKSRITEATALDILCYDLHFRTAFYTNIQFSLLILQVINLYLQMEKNLHESYTSWYFIVERSNCRKMNLSRTYLSVMVGKKYEGIVAQI